MKSEEMQIQVYRNDDNVVCFRYPKDWDADKVFEQICELCATLQDELKIEKYITDLLRYRLDTITKEDLIDMED